VVFEKKNYFRGSRNHFSSLRGTGIQASSDFTFSFHLYQGLTLSRCRFGLYRRICLCILSFYPGEIRWTEHVTHIVALSPVYKLLVRIQEGKTPCRRPKRRWKDNVKLKITVFWDVVPCSLAETDRRFRDVYCLHNLPP
jgi:hypothetical protein